MANALTESLLSGLNSIMTEDNRNDMTAAEKRPAIPISPAAALVAIGVVYGDIGTSPMYVMKSIVAGNGGLNSVDPQLILGSLSLVIWTLTLLTTVKYVLVAMQADNHGEGGIFSLYSIVRRSRKHLVVLAMVGGAALLADGVLTPAVTVTTAVEGLRSIPALALLLGPGQSRIIQITLVIVPDSAGRNKFHRQGLWSHHDDLVPVFRRHGSLPHGRGLDGVAGAEPHAGIAGAGEPL